MYTYNYSNKGGNVDSQGNLSLYLFLLATSFVLANAMSSEHRDLLTSSSTCLFNAND